MSVNRHCSVSTQKIALNALVYLYKRFLGVDIGDLRFLPGNHHRRLPIVYSREEITAILKQLNGVHRLQVELVDEEGD